MNKYIDCCGCDYAEKRPSSMSIGAVDVFCAAKEDRQAQSFIKLFCDYTDPPQWCPRKGSNFK